MTAAPISSLLPRDSRKCFETVRFVLNGSIRAAGKIAEVTVYPSEPTSRGRDQRSRRDTRRRDLAPRTRLKVSRTSGDLFTGQHACMAVGSAGQAGSLGERRAPRARERIPQYHHARCQAITHRRCGSRRTDARDPTSGQNPKADLCCHSNSEKTDKSRSLTATRAARCWDRTRHACDPEQVNCTPCVCQRLGGASCERLWRIPSTNSPMVTCSSPSAIAHAAADKGYPAGSMGSAVRCPHLSRRCDAEASAAMITPSEPRSHEHRVPFVIRCTLTPAVSRAGRNAPRPFPRTAPRPASAAPGC